MVERIPSFTAACGALDRAERGRVLAMARSFNRAAQVVHEDADSILALDREPICWGAEHRRGLAWEEQPGSGSSEAHSWQEAAVGSAGLAIGGARPHVHSSVSGVAPIYFIPDGEAVYFATSIDAVVASCERRLTVDWEAWASILTLSHPIGDRTPFLEVRRLGPSSLLSCPDGRTNVRTERWPWAEAEPKFDVEAGAEAVLGGMRAAVARLAAGPVLCQLSGGLDSRLCLGLLAEARSDDVRAITVDEDMGVDSEQRVAAALAAEVDAPHEVVVGELADFWSELTELARRVDYQAIRSPWRMPILARIKRAGATVADGFGFDTFAAPGDRFLSPATADPRGGDGVVRALWDSMSRKRARPGGTGLNADLADVLWDLTERQLMAESERFHGHPTRALLTFYLARQIRGVALAPTCVLGAEAPVAMPLLDDHAVRATLAISLRSKRGGRLYDALFAALNPRLGRMPTTRRAINGSGEAPRRSQTTVAADAMKAALEEGPLAPYLRPGQLKALSRHTRGGLPRAPSALLGPAYFHLWHERYRDRLSEVDPRDAFHA